jgi:membrane protease YdiL (CAAX protease family)
MVNWHLINTEWKTFQYLLTGCIAGIIGIVPYQLHLLRSSPTATGSAIPAPSTKQVTIGVIASSLQLAGLLYVSLLMQRSSPLIDCSSASPIDWQDVAWRGALPGVALGVLVLLLDQCVRTLSRDPQLHQLHRVAQTSSPAAYGLFAPLYGGFVEEVLLRQFLLTLLCIVIPSHLVGDTSIWLAIAVDNLLFGLGHLPATAALLGCKVSALSMPVIARCLVLNGIAGLYFSWLFWQHSIECSIAAHLSADVVLIQVGNVLQKHSTAKQHHQAAR